MDINTILKNGELNNLLESSINKTYYRFKLSFIIDIDDFRQEVFLFLIPRIKNFNNEKSTLKTYLPLIVMSCAKNCITNANGQSKNSNKLEFKNNCVSLEDELKNAENLNARFSDHEINSEDLATTNLIINEILETGSLSNNQKLIIKHMSKGYSRSDIAEMMDKSLSCINITFQRAKEKIVRKYAF